MDTQIRAEVVTVIFPAEPALRIGNTFQLNDDGSMSPLSAITTTRHHLGGVLAAIPDGRFFIKTNSGHARIHRKEGFFIEHELSGDLRPDKPQPPELTDLPHDPPVRLVMDGETFMFIPWQTADRRATHGA